jgi:hypothetical protein
MRLSAVRYPPQSGGQLMPDASPPDPALTPAWDEKQVCRQLADFAIALRESRRINVEARWKRQTAAERSSYVRPIARRAG